MRNVVFFLYSNGTAKRADTEAKLFVVALHFVAVLFICMPYAKHQIRQWQSKDKLTAGKVNTDKYLGWE